MEQSVQQVRSRIILRVTPVPPVLMRARPQAHQ